MCFEIKNSIYYVGVLNPNLRIFDIIMETEFGTSYNAYIVKGEKTALVETVHTTFFDQYLENIKELIDPKDIDYVILNHTEPDHSGSLKALLRINPDIKVVVSKAGHLYAKAISNHDYDYMIVQDNDTLDLGGKTLRFINAPFLHWPDSMFTYVEEDNLIFTCDFLGCHYCEPTMYDTKVVYPQCYDKSLEYYFNVIFGPFKKYVLKGLEKIKNLEFDTVCTSHGPILTETIDIVVEKYEKWASTVKETNKNPKVLIAFVSAYGCTEKMACEIKRALEDAGGIEVEAINLTYDDTTKIKDKIEESDGLLFGSPTINRDALKPVWDLLSIIDVNINQGKPCGIFGSYGWSGEAVKMLTERAKGLRLKVYKEGLRINFVPSEDELAQTYEFGKGFAKELIKK